MVLEDTVKIINLLAEKAVAALKNSSNPFLVAERLNGLGSVIIPHLEKLLTETEDTETKILSALVLLQLNSKIGVSVLLDAIIQDEEYSGLIAVNLAKKGVKEAIQPIIKRLKICELKQIDLIVNLLEALGQLNGKLTQDLYQHLTAINTPWQIRTLTETMIKEGIDFSVVS